MSDNQIVQSVSNYKSYDAYLSRLRYARVPLNNVTSSSVNISLNANSLLEWKIPSKTVVNLARSFISYQYTVPALAGNYGVCFEDNQDLLTWLYFGDGGGLGVCDTNYVDRYTSIAAPLRHTNVEANSRDIINTIYTTNQINTQNVLPFSQDGLAAGTINQSTDSFTELQHLRFSSGQNTAMTVTRQLPLSIFKDTFVGLDKNVIFGRDMYLRGNTQYASRLGFNCTSNANPNSTATAFTSVTAPQAFNNVYLFLAIEENKVLVDSLMSSLLAGTIKFQIPYTYTYRYGAATSSSSNMTITLTRQFGHKVKRLLYAPFCGTESSYTSFDHSNVNGTRVTQLQSAIDSRPLTDYQLNCFNPNNPVIPPLSGFSIANTGIFGDDYREMRKLLIGSCIPSYAAYQNFWFYADVWGMQDFQRQSLQSTIDDSNLNDGLNLLDSDHVYTLQLTTPAVSAVGSVTATSGLVHYLFALFERTLHITADGIAFE